MDPLTLATQARGVKFTGAACMTCLLYNHLITFDQEVSRMWPAKLSLAKILFFLNRYVVECMLIFNCIGASVEDLSPDLSVAFPHPYLTLLTRVGIISCVFFLRWLVVTLTVTNAVVQGILVIRVWALYRRNMIAIGIVLFFYLSGVIVLMALTIHDYVGEDVIINNELDVLPGCYALTVPDIIGGYWIAPVIIESVLFLMVISRAYIWWKEGSSAPRILSLLARDSTIYFAVVFALLIANLMVFKLGPPFLSSLLVTPSTTAGCILGSHMLLNLRAMLDPNADQEFHKSTFATKIMFVPPPRTRTNRGSTNPDELEGTHACTNSSGTARYECDDDDEEEDEHWGYAYNYRGQRNSKATTSTDTYMGTRPTRKWKGNPYLGGPGYSNGHASGSGSNGKPNP